MSRKLTFTIICALVILAVMPNTASAYFIDGSLADWGITPFVNWVPSSATAEYIEEDWTITPHYSGYIGTGGQPTGGEGYDVEALYFDNDAQYLYFAMVSSFPLRGRNSTKAGDLAIDLSQNPPFDFEYGIKIKGMDTVDYGFSNRELRENPEWYYKSNGLGPVHMTDFGSLAGMADIYYWNAESLYNEPGTTFNTWVLEGRIDTALFSHTFQDGDPVRLHWMMSCANDYIGLTGDFNVIPEPATLSLLGLGVLGICGLKRKRGAKK